jgi:hypothetical protein
VVEEKIMAGDTFDPQQFTALGGKPPSPPVDEADREARTGRWMGFFERLSTDPELQQMLTAIGVNLAQPIQPGQSTLGHVAQSLAAGQATRAKSEELGVQRAQRDEELARRERERVQRGESEEADRAQRERESVRSETGADKRLQLRIEQLDRVARDEATDRATRTAIEKRKIKLLEDQARASSEAAGMEFDQKNFEAALEAATTEDPTTGMEIIDITAMKDVMSIGQAAIGRPQRELPQIGNVNIPGTPAEALQRARDRIKSGQVSGVNDEDLRARLRQAFPGKEREVDRLFEQEKKAAPAREPRTEAERPLRGADVAAEADRQRAERETQQKRQIAVGEQLSGIKEQVASVEQQLRDGQIQTRDKAIEAFDRLQQLQEEGQKTQFFDDESRVQIQRLLSELKRIIVSGGGG